MEPAPRLPAAVGGLRFRTPRSDDLDAVRAMVDASGRATVGDNERIQDRLAAGEGNCRVAEWQGRVVAYASWRQDEGIAVLDLHVAAASVRGWRVETALLEDVLKHLREEGIRSVEAASAGGLDADLYRQLGFREMGVVRGAARFEKKLRRR